MSVESELTALEGYITSAYSKINDKGGTIPQDKNMQNLTDAIDSISTGSIIIIPPEAGTLTSISVTSNPTKTTYNEGEYFNFSGLVITALYSSGQQFDVTNSCTYTMNQPLQYGDTSILVAYETATTSITITVNALPIPAPSSCIGLYHFEDDFVNEKTENTGTGTSSFINGKFGRAVKANSTFRTEAFSLSATDISTGEFTIEFWIKEDSNYGHNYYIPETCGFRTNNDAFIRFFDIYTSPSGGLAPNDTSSGIASSRTVDSSTPNFSIYNWNHIALVISQGNFELYVNGVKNSHGVMRLRDYVAFQINYDGQVSYSMNCGFDELMFCTTAKYSANFTPPNAPYYIEQNNG